jgi:predicted choloylglycine hydrolase
MIYVKVETQKVYSYGSDGMPKIEKIEQTFSETFEFPKFLKYLPFQGYLVDRLKVLVVWDQEKDAVPLTKEQFAKFAAGKESFAGYTLLDSAKWQKMLADVVASMNVQEKTIHDKYEEKQQQYEAQKKLNDELMERIALIEAKMFPHHKDNIMQVYKQKQGMSDIESELFKELSIGEAPKTETPETEEGEQEVKEAKGPTVIQLKKMYMEKFGQRPHHLWNSAKLKEKLGIN